MCGTAFELGGQELIHGNEVNALRGILGTLLIFAGENPSEHAAAASEGLARGLAIAAAMAEAGLKY